jgi:3-oxoacyl-[acyl-carrier protein] reductase
MIRQNQSYIINISSIVGLYGNIGQANYAASKAGLIALTKTLSKEYGSRNICVNAIAPGFIKTKMTENLQDNIKQKALERISLNRFGTTQDIANLVLFLTSGQADYITGQVIEISGGIN